MIEVQEARKIVTENLLQPGSESIPLSQALHRILASNILSPIDHPVFDQTAVDGYAIQHADYLAGIPIRVVSEIQAGDSGQKEIKAGEAARIFTGAPIPPGADTVVMQEFVERDGNKIAVKDPGLKPGGNIRRRGEQIRKGDIALEAGHVINPGTIGFLASLGIREIKVAQTIRVSVMVTGNEFASSFGDLSAGKIYESNGQMLKSAFLELAISASFQTQKDDLAAMTEAVAELESQVDLLVVTGGVSVGDYDFTRAALEANDFEILFHKIAQKPGKPMLFARKGNKFAFGLPGNPRAVLVCYQQYVAPWLRASQGHPEPFPTAVRLPAANAFRRKPGRAAFVAAKADARGVTLLEGQESHMLRSMALANCIAFLAKDRAEVRPGDVLEVYL